MRLATWQKLYLLELPNNERVGVFGHGATEIVDCPVDEIFHLELAEVCLEIGREIGR